MLNRLIGSTMPLVVAGSMVLANSAMAMDCSDLNVARIQNNVEKARLIADYPGTAAALFTCAVTATNQTREADRLPTLLMCAGVTCLIVGFDTCFDLGVRVIAVQQRSDWIDTQEKANCPLRDPA